MRLMFFVSPAKVPNTAAVALAITFASARALIQRRFLAKSYWPSEAKSPVPRENRSFLAHLHCPPKWESIRPVVERYVYLN